MSKANREEMSWEEERKYCLTLPKGKLRVRIAESCKHFLSGLCCESLDAGRAWTCFFLRDVPKETILECKRMEKNNDSKRKD